MPELFLTVKYQIILKDNIESTYRSLYRHHRLGELKKAVPHVSTSIYMFTICVTTSVKFSYFGLLIPIYHH